MIRIVEVSILGLMLNQHTTRIHGCILSVHRRVSTNIGGLCGPAYDIDSRREPVYTQTGMYLRLDEGVLSLVSDYSSTIG